MTEAHPEQDSGLLQKAMNFAKAAVRHVADGRKHVSDVVCLARLAICADCPWFDPTRATCRQKTCGCRVKKKARWRSENCPLGKWPSPEGV